MEYLILAYLGDAVYELIVRNHLINKGIKNVNDLQTESLNFVSAKSQRKLLEKLEQKGIIIANVTLHVGIGTFRPVKEDTVEAHKMHSEHFYIKQEDVDKINKAKEEGRRVIAVGTTSCRVLESVADEKTGKVRKIEDDTEIFIYPGYKFKCIDGLITNFHLPQSTLLMLVSALADKEFILQAYNEAVKERYRFFSFGDAMLII